jgi:pimeloyl-ACP methyl ester carboxylesterase
MRRAFRLAFWLSLIPILLAFTPALPAASATAKRESTPQILKRLGGRPCPDSEFTCVTLRLPLDHFDSSDTRTIDVVFAVLPATGDRKGMFVTATGGPGTSGLAYKDSYTPFFDPGILKRFDIVFFDQRGIGASGGLTCPEATLPFYQASSRAETPAQEAALKNTAHTYASACVAEMGDPPILPYLGTAQAVEDLDRFRQLMQDDKLWLYGESYGTQYAQTYTAAHRQHVAGLVLDGTVDLTLDGITYYDIAAQSFNQTLVATLQLCDDDPSCAADIEGGALAAYDKLARQLKRGPIRFNFPLASGEPARRSFSFDDLETVAVGQMYGEGDRMIFTRALAAAADRDDLAPLARLLYLSLGQDSDSLEIIPDPSWSDAIYYAVECQDYGYFSGTPDQRAEQFLRANDPIEARTPRMTSLLYGDLPCVYWPDSSTDTSRPAPLIAPGVPTLVLNAQADPITPLSNAVSVYQHLDDAYLITQQGGPHVIYGRGVACIDDIVTAFLVRDKRPSARQITCAGVVADTYVPLAPANASRFESALEAFQSAENEIYYLPEYYYWDGFTPTGAGCPYSGALTFEPDGANTIFTLDQCAFSRGWKMTGSGSYNPNRDRFVLEVTVGGIEYRYVREGERVRVTTRATTEERLITPSRRSVSSDNRHHRHFRF